LCSRIQCERHAIKNLSHGSIMIASKMHAKVDKILPNPSEKFEKEFGSF
jgi:hypothetical protein